MTGCAWLPVFMGPDLRKPTPVEKVEISYRLDAGQMHVPLATARIDGHSFSYDRVGGSVLPDRTVTSLKITYPHPDALADCARAEVQIESAAMPDVLQLDHRPGESLPWYRRMSAPAPSPNDAQHETWVMDVPRTQLDDLMGVLATPGHVQLANRGQTTGVTLSTDFNQRRSQGACQRIPELDGLMSRVRNSGRLVAYSRPLSARSQQLEYASLADQQMLRMNGPATNPTAVAGDPTGQPAAAPIARITGVIAR